jgi:hypothetical protein
MLSKLTVSVPGPAVAMTVIWPSMAVEAATTSKTTAPTLVNVAPEPAPTVKSFAISIKYSASACPLVSVSGTTARDQLLASVYTRNVATPLGRATPMVRWKAVALPPCVKSAPWPLVRRPTGSRTSPRPSGPSQTTV